MGPAPRLGRWLPRFVGILAALVAFRSLIDPFGATPATSEMEQFFFERSDSVWTTLGAAAWLGWRRIDRVRELERRSAIGSSVLVWGLSVAIFAWALFVDANDLLVIALVALLAGAVIQEKGWRAIRVLGLPFMVALLSIPLPGPIDNEVVWAAQRGATLGAHATLRFLGFPVEMSDMALHHEGHVFWVVETCSGLRAVVLLTISALVIRDLLGPEPRRLWWLVAIAPILALAFNVARIAAIVALQSSQADPKDHVVQGLASVFAGALLLFAAGHVMKGARSAANASGGNASGADSVVAATNRHGMSDEGWTRTAICCVVLAFLSLAIRPWPIQPGEAPSIEVFERSEAGWEAERIGDSFAAIGELPFGEAISTRFVRAIPEHADVEAVELRVVVEAPGTIRRTLRASRLDTLGPEWRTESLGSIHLWQVDRKARVSLGRRGGIQVLSYRWGYPERSWLGTVVESALAIRRIPGHAFRRPVDVRIATIVPGDGSPARRARARRILDDFLTSFGPRIRRLEATELRLSFQHLVGPLHGRLRPAQ